MHLLQGLVAALLLPASLSAAEPRLGILAGAWHGTVTVSPGGCAWTVKANVTEKRGYAAGRFSYAGICASQANTGTFNASPAEEGCFTIVPNIKGLPTTKLSACFDRNGDLAFTSMLFNGTLKFSEKGTIADLEAGGMLGRAGGRFKKQFKEPAAGAVKKGKKDVKPVKKPLEVHGGSN